MEKDTPGLGAGEVSFAPSQPYSDKRGDEMTLQDILDDDTRSISGSEGDESDHASSRSRTRRCKSAMGFRTIQSQEGSPAKGGDAKSLLTTISLRPIRTVEDNASSLCSSRPGSPRGAEEGPRSPRSPIKAPGQQHELRKDPKNWVQREDVIVPTHEDHDDDVALLEKEVSSIWSELLLSNADEEKEPGSTDGDVSSGGLGRTEKIKRTVGSILRSPKIWTWIIIGIVQLTAFVLGVCTLVYQPPDLTWQFQSWRVSFLVSLLPFTWIFGDIFCWLFIKFVENCMFTVPNALYFAYATKGPLRWVMRFLTLTILWALLMTVGTDEQLQKINQAYDYILKILGCITLFFTANLLKRLAAKGLALNLHTGKQQYKLEAALTKEKILRALLGGGNRAPFTSKPFKRSGLLYSSTNAVSKLMEQQCDYSSGHHSIESPRKGSTYHAQAYSPSAVFDVESQSAAIDKASSPKTQTKNEDNVKKRKQEISKKRKEIIQRLNLLETYIRNHAIAVSFKDELNQTNIAKVENQMEAKRVGSFLYWNLKGSLSSEGIVKEDLEGYVPREELDLAFAMLDIHGQGVVSLKDCIKGVESIFLERRNLANTLKDSRNINKTLETLIGIILHVIFIFFYLLIFQADVSNIWVSLSGIIIGFSFIFSKTVADIFDNVVFLFGTHPYAIGDLLLVNDEQMVVEEITLNFTCCTTAYNRTLWMPNQVLIKSPFTNLSTSGNFFEVIVVYVDMDTAKNRPNLPFILQEKLKDAVKEHASEFGHTLRANYEFSETPLKLGIKIVYDFSHPGTDFGRCSKARGILYAVIGEVLTDHEVEYSWPNTKDGRGSLHHPPPSDLRI